MVDFREQNRKECTDRFAIENSGGKTSKVSLGAFQLFIFQHLPNIFWGFFSFHVPKMSVACENEYSSVYLKSK